MTLFSDIEFFLLNLVQNIRFPFLDRIMILISAIGNHGTLFIICGFALLFFKKTRRTGAMMLTSMALGFLLGNLIIKPLIHRVRPYDVLNFQIIIDPLKDYSFPSGHTLSSFAAGFSVWLNNKKYGIFVIILAILIGFSRLYLFVHYPSDVLFGAALGILCAYISNKFIRKDIKLCQ